MWKVALGVVVITCATGSVIAADVTVPTPLYKAPAPIYNWIDWYFGLYFAGSAGPSWGAITNPAFAFAYVGRGADTGADNVARFDVFPTPNAFIGGGQMGADRQWGNFAGGVFQGVGINALGAATATIPPRCTVAPTRCDAATTQSLFQNNLDFLGALRATPGPVGDNSLSFGIDVGNSEGYYDRARTEIRPGSTGENFKGTLSYTFDWQ
jgi:hypothetical protein